MRRRLLAVLLSLGLALLLVVGLEGGLRLFGPGGREAFAFEAAFPSLAGDRLFETHGERFFTLVPGYRTSEAHAGRYATGAWPFRGAPLDPAPAGLARVAFLGDSCIYGTGLDAADTLPEQVARRLGELGAGPERVQVLNYGVPGYSTVQMAALLDEILATVKPRVVVIYPGAWNDQAPALGSDDVARREFEASWRGALQHSALRKALSPASAEASSSWSEVRSRWERTGEAPYGPRVPPEAFTLELARMRVACERAGAALVLVAPAHPAETAAAFPRTREDAARVGAFAGRSATPLVDAQAVLDSAELSDGERFLDFVHPSPLAFRWLAEPLATLVRDLLGDVSACPSLGRFAVHGDSLPMLGDVEVILRFEESLPETLPTVVVGGAPLLELERLDEHDLRGIVPANAPGRQAVVVRSRRGVSVLDEAVEFRLPALSLSADRGACLVTSRPGDEVRLALALEREPRPRWRPDGPHWLRPETLLRLLVGTCDDLGVARLALPAEAAHFHGSLQAQVGVVPKGLRFDDGAGRWAAPRELRFD